MGTHRAVTEPDRLAGRIEPIDRRLRLDLQSEHSPGFDRPLIQEQVVAVQVDVDSERPLGGGDTGDVIDVRVRQQDVPDCQVPARGVFEQRRHFVAGINQDGLVRAVAANDEAVLEEGTDGPGLNYDHEVILAIVDDLLFMSKIRTTAGQLGVRVTFVRSPDAALSQMRADAPAVVILDLNNPRTDPLGTVAQMKADPALAGIPTVGFVSHVQTDLIDAARRAGVDQVLARSAFTQLLPDILQRGTTSG
jgi:CheY-like chemotaxis protein